MTGKIRCWQYFSCSNSSCIEHGRDTCLCWQNGDTPCNHGGGIKEETNAANCFDCPVFEANADLKSLKQFVRTRYHKVLEREQQAEKATREMAEGFTEILDMVNRLCQGDPSVRLATTGDNNTLNALGSQLNRLAESIETMINDEHELAIGICEHYDTLNRLSSGELTAMASESSSNDLIARLGTLINTGTHTLVRTIEELQQTDANLKAAYQKMSNIIEFLPDATFVIDHNGVIIAWNQALEEMTGMRQEEMLGKGNGAYAVPFFGDARPILIDFIGKDIESIRTHYSSVRQEGNKLFAEAHITGFRNDKEKDVYILVTAAPLIDRDGIRIGAVESVRDITAYKLSEISRDKLEDQLRQAQKMEAIGQLAGGIAHDFNNFLTAIIGYASLLQRRLPPESDLQNYINQINLSSGKAAKLTQDLLAYSRKRILNPYTVDINSIIAGIAGLLSRLLTEDIGFTINSINDPLIVNVDKDSIGQVLMNLVANARDAMPDGGSLTISTHTVDEIDSSLQSTLSKSSRFAVIVVTDTGYGMDEETRSRIFEPFFTTKDVGKGTGLGLSTVYGIISQHSGHISVISDPGHGTSFRIFLPLQSTPGLELGSEQPVLASASKGGGETILLAEDHEDTRAVMEEVLGHAGYQVISAVDGEEAVTLFKKHCQKICMVILDVVMPKKNGREAYAEIVKDCPDIKILFTSGYTAEIIHRKGQLDRNVNFIAKPMQPNELLGKVREVLDS
jgi:PAS domain S-box-containing protein